MLESLRKSPKQNRCCEIYLTSIPPLGPLVPTSLKAFHSMLFNLVGIQFVNKKGWITMRGAKSRIEEMSPMYILKWTKPCI